MSTNGMTNLNASALLGSGPLSTAELEQHIVERFRRAEGADTPPEPAVAAKPRFEWRDPLTWPLSVRLEQSIDKPYPRWIVAAVVVAMLAALAIAGSATPPLP
jgi:hypothetical protein